MTTVNLLIYFFHLRYCFQAQGQMHSVAIDKTDGCIVYLSKECLGADIVTAKSSEMNVSVPKDNGDFVSLLSVIA